MRVSDLLRKEFLYDSLGGVTKTARRGSQQLLISPLTGWHWIARQVLLDLAGEALYTGRLNETDREQLMCEGLIQDAEDWETCELTGDIEGPLDEARFTMDVL
jgi:hypothetical protein